MSSLVHSSLIYSADRYCAFIADIDLYTCTLDNSIDGFSSLTNHITDLLRVDLDLDDLRSVFIYIVTRLCNTFFHNLCKNVFSCLFCSADSFLYDRSGKSVDFNIHLDGSDTLMSSGYLEVHISEEVFKSLDICENNVIIICIACYQTTGNSSYRFADRHSGCHQRHGGCTDTCLRGRAV